MNQYDTLSAYFTARMLNTPYRMQAKQSVLYLLLRASEKQSSGLGEDKSLDLGEDKIVSHCINFLMAAYDTTSFSLAICSFLLATHPAVQDKLCHYLDQYWKKNPVSLSCPLHLFLSNSFFSSSLLSECFDCCCCSRCSIPSHGHLWGPPNVPCGSKVNNMSLHKERTYFASMDIPWYHYYADYYHTLHCIKALGNTMNLIRYIQVAKEMFTVSNSRKYKHSKWTVNHYPNWYLSP